ncbi:LPXTG cell wall anchor domain-containing protein [Candidatus Saccharibacteria bacterium]|nr:LPXTG cell wall anchor domain-containing protein [Candidatus Saccharibacteria bacterium]
MGVIVSKDRDQNSRLTERINSDLRERAMKSSSDVKDPDLAEDSEYVRDFKKTGHFGWIWFVLIGLALISIVIIVVV